MHYRSLAALAAFAIPTMMSVVAVPDLRAQDVAAARFHSALSRHRALRWAMAARVIRCGPAPLTERPGVQWELTRPHVTPLESAFADAASVKRAVASLRTWNER